MKKTWLFTILLLLATAASAQNITSLNFSARSLTGPMVPMQGIQLELSLINPGSGPVTGVPQLEPNHIWFQILLTAPGGEEQALLKPIMTLNSYEKDQPFRIMEPGEQDRRVHQIGFDWDRKTFLFNQTGTYSLRVVLRSQNNDSELTSNTVVLNVASPDGNRTRELTDLQAIGAYQYSFAPQAINFDREASAKVDALTNFLNTYPGSPYSRDLPMVIAMRRHYEAVVLEKRNPDRAQAVLTQLKSLLENYLSQPTATYQEQAQQIYTGLFGNVD